MSTTITEADRATARRVIRRHVGAGYREGVYVNANFAGPERHWTKRDKSSDGSKVYWIGVDVSYWNATCEAAALGRVYGKALRGAK